MRPFVDVRNATGDLLGEGPVMLTSGTATKLLDGSGGIKLDCPATARGRELLQPGRYIDLWYELDADLYLLGQGIIKQDGLSSSGDSISVDCNDLLEELKWDNTLLNWQVNGSTVQQAVSDLISPLGWAIEASGSAATSTVTLTFKGDTKLKALLSVAENTGTHVRITNRKGRILQVGDFGRDSGITLFGASSGAGGNAWSGVLEGLSKDRAGDQIANRILAIGGAFESNPVVTLADSTRSGILSILGRDGALNYYVQSTASIATYGVRWLFKTYPDIKPLDATGAARIAASNQLCDAANADLARMGTVRRSYKGKVRGLKTLLLPGDLVKVQYSDPIFLPDGSIWTGGLLDEDLYIVRAETYAGEGGWWQNVELSNINSQAIDAASDVATAISRTKKLT